MMPEPDVNTARSWVEWYLASGFRVVFWRDKGDAKSPTEDGWTTKLYTIDDYRDGDRVGLMTGVELAPGHFFHDVDIDWEPGLPIATAMLPATTFEYGRASKLISHRGFSLPVALPLKKFEDPITDASGKRQTLIELRGTKDDGSIGWQSMAPPSIWQKDGKREALTFRHRDVKLTACSDAERFQHEVALTATGMLLAKHLGHNGFGHDARLEWAGFLLREGVDPEDLVRMGEAMSKICNNTEVSDVRRAVQSTVQNLQAEGKKVKGGPALAKRIGKGGRKIIATIREWLGRARGFARTKDGAIIAANQENILLALELLNVTLSYDEFANRMLIREDDGAATIVEDPQIVDLWLRIDREYGFRPGYDFFEKVIDGTARANKFHPVKDYLDSLTWDGTRRIDTWLEAYGAATIDEDSTAYLRAVSAIQLMAPVKRIYEPGCHFDEMVVWESPQGFEKSTALRALCPNPEWFTDDLPLTADSKKLLEQTQGKWIVEVSELSGMRKAEVEQLKALQSRQVDEARLSYGRKTTRRARQFTLNGTTNAEVYLVDSTGNRRWWPIKVGRFKIDELKRDRDQLWAEAKHRVLNGESIRLHKDLWPIAAKEQAARTIDEPWAALIENYIASVEPDGDGRRRIHTSDLFTTVGLQPERRDLVASRRISQVMQNLGFKRTKVYDETISDSVPGYIEIEVKVAQVAAQAEQVQF